MSEVIFTNNREKLKALFDTHGASPIWPFASKHLVDAILMKVKEENVDEDRFELGESKIGGYPHLPENISWDQMRYKYEDKHDVHLSFILQLNFEEIAKYDRMNLLPKKGIFYFFAVHGDEYVNDFDIYDNSYKGIYIEEPQNLRVTPPDFEPTEQEIRYYSENKPKGFSIDSPKAFYEDRLFSASKLDFEEIISLPSMGYLFERYKNTVDSMGNPFPDWNDSCWHTYYSKLRSNRNGGDMEILGYGGNAYQGEDFDRFDAGFECEYQLLFQISSINGMNWRNCYGFVLCYY